MRRPSIPWRSRGMEDEQLESCLVPYETWTHAAVTFNGEKAVLYMNGTPVLERTAAAGLGTLALHKQITIGALNHDAVTFQFNGAIDEAVYANYPMKATEIAALGVRSGCSCRRSGRLGEGNEDHRAGCDCHAAREHIGAFRIADRRHYDLLLALRRELRGSFSL